MERETCPIATNLVDQCEPDTIFSPHRPSPTQAQQNAEETEVHRQPAKLSHQSPASHHRVA